MIHYWIYHYLDRYIGIPLCLILGFFNKLFFSKQNQNCKFNKILVIKVGMIGDTILLIPVLRALREKYFHSDITMLCSNMNKEIVEDLDYIDDYIVFNFVDYLKRPWKFIKFILKLKRRNFDITIDFETWPRIIPLIAYFSGSKIRVGFNVPKQLRHFLFTNTVKHIRKKHELECFIDIVNSIGVKIKNPSLELKVEEKKLKKIEEILQRYISNNDQFVIIHPGCGIHGYYRRWSEEKYAQLADYIIEDYGLKVVITGSKDDRRVVKKVILSMKNTPLDLSGKTTLKELFALVKKSYFVICGNTGILHIAAALGKTTIALHGPTDPEKWGPWGKGHIIIRKDLPCSPCLYLGFEYGCKKQTCMELITVDEVKEAVDKLIRS